MRPFTLHEPTSAAEASALLLERGEAARLYAGGTELLLVMKGGFLPCDHLVNVKTIPGMDAIALDGGALVIGAAATHAAIESTPLVRERFSLLAQVERRVANVRVRNVGTLAGNLCFAEPHSDPAALLLLYDAEATVEGASGERRIPIADLQTGPYETALEPGEVMTAIRVRPLPNDARAAYLRFGIHHRPTIGVGAMLRVVDGVVAEARLSLGSVPPMARRLLEAEALLVGERAERLNAESSAVAAAGDAAAARADAVNDLHGSAEYKRHLARVFVRRAITQAAA